MSDLNRRLKRAEKKLNLGQEPITVNIVCYGVGELPPDSEQGNVTIHYVAYDRIEKQ
jgi:hypothetical protein